MKPKAKKTKYSNYYGFNLIISEWFPPKDVESMIYKIKNIPEIYNFGQWLEACKFRKGKTLEELYILYKLEK